MALVGSSAAGRAAGGRGRRWGRLRSPPAETARERLTTAREISRDQSLLVNRPLSPNDGPNRFERSSKSQDEPGRGRDGSD
eukprot:scaffold221807_cov26-Tisochrysis_lutea.AAC.1